MIGLPALSKPVPASEPAELGDGNPLSKEEGKP
jgi:hypothetical protein